MEEEGEIRLVRSSVALYASLVIRLLFSIAFVIITARKLHVEEFASLGLILAFSMVGAQPTIIWNFWAQRAAARKQEHAVGSALVLNIAYMFLVLLPLYLVFSYIEAAVLDVDPELLLVGWTYVILTPLSNSLFFLGIVVIPESVAVVRTIYESIRISLTYVLIIMLKMGYDGVIVALNVSIASAILGMLIALNKTSIILNKIDKNAMKYWIKNWYIPVMSAIPNLLRTLNRPYISWLTGNSLTVAYLNVAITSETPLLTASRFSAQPMYSRLLRKPSPDDVRTAIGLYFLFIGLLSSLLIGAPKAIVNLYNPRYLDAWIVLVLITLYAVLYGLTFILSRALMALERRDVERLKITRSSILVKTIEAYTIIALIAYISAAPLVIYFSESPVNSLIVFALILLSFNGITSIIFWRWLSINLATKFPVRDVAGAILGMALSVLTLNVMGVNSMLYREFTLQLKSLILPFIIASLVYSGVAVSISPLAKKIVKRGFQIITRK